MPCPRLLRPRRRILRRRPGWSSKETSACLARSVSPSRSTRRPPSTQKSSARQISNWTEPLVHAWVEHGAFCARGFGSARWIFALRRRLTLPPKNVSLAEWFNASKENGNDEDSAGALHAGIQAGGGAAGPWRPEHRSGGQGGGGGARTLGVVEQTLFNWVKADRLGKLTGADSKAVSAEQMEISRLRAELARVKMGRDILGKATAYCAKAQS